ncbi:MAG: HAD-IIIC family phosphatase [Lentisphaeraceae bacterium]|nr:HAD-IIIC family phosphatase [Lentisphaeraceae bacterium]
MKYSEILKRNLVLRDQFSEQDAFNITVLANITVNQLNEILEMHVRELGINAVVNNGDFDNIVQDSAKFSKSSCVVIFWELSDLIDGFHYKAEVMAQEQLENLMAKLKGEIVFTFNNLKETPLVFFNLFSPFTTGKTINTKNKLTSFADEINQYVVQTSPANVSLVNLNEVKAVSSEKSSLDWRFYGMSKAPYTVEFFINYCEYIKPVFSSLAGKSRKALIFDCDNTLWKGTLGEDGFDGIEMSSANRGRAFEEIQYMARSLSQKGVLIGLCSKNNYADVDEVLDKHPDIILKQSDIAIKKVNWEDKADNLLAISKELNIGLDSLVFIDDSNFEIENIKSRLPEVHVVKVPKNLHEYPVLFKDVSSLFYNHSSSDEDALKTQMYKIEGQRKESQASFQNVSDYLQSLELKLTIFIDNNQQVARLSQLTQKTNQFNMTTRRYSEAEISTFVSSPDHRIYSFVLEDKFGSYGLTGMAIVEIKGKQAVVDTFLMSCRVIGRNIEFNFFDFVFQDMLRLNIEEMTASYTKTPKNSQVAKLWDEFGFILKDDGDEKVYRIEKNQYINKSKSYIINNKS